jgi:hypothetical protein
MVHGVNGQNGHLVQNLVGVVPGDDTASVTVLHQRLEASLVLELMDSRSIVTDLRVQFMESGTLLTHSVILNSNVCVQHFV